MDDLFKSLDIDKGELEFKPRRGRQRKVWSRMVDDLFKSLDIDKGEWLEDIECGDS